MEQNLINVVESKIKAALPDAFVSSEMLADYPVLVIKKDAIADVVAFLYNDPDLSFQYLTTLAGLHYPDNEGQEFGVMYQLHNLPKNLRIRLKIFFDKKDLAVPSITDTFAGANWMERQEFDFFGIQFKGHPNLKRILNMDEMDYHPMRKEYALEDGTREDKDDTMFGR
jgi:NADH-quinone oxidoreductase subunit C